MGCDSPCFLKLWGSFSYHWAFIVLNMDDSLTRQTQMIHPRCHWWWLHVLLKLGGCLLCEICFSPIFCLLNLYHLLALTVQIPQGSEVTSRLTQLRCCLGCRMEWWGTACVPMGTLCPGVATFTPSIDSSCGAPCQGMGSGWGFAGYWPLCKDDRCQELGPFPGSFQFTSKNIVKMLQRPCDASGIF